MIKEAFLAGLKKGLTAGMRSLPKHVQDEIVKQHVREGVGFSLALPMWAAGKMVGKRPVTDAIKKLQAPGLHLDTTMGYHAKKLPLIGKIFNSVEHVKSGPKKIDLVDRPSITAPLAKATEIAKPIVFGLAVDKVVRDLRNKKKNEQST